MILATARTAVSPDTVSVEIEQLAHLVAAVLNEHVNSGGRCAACHGAQSFPCASAVLAEHNTALLP
jgi:hypothetical protein